MYTSSQVSIFQLHIFKFLELIRNSNGRLMHKDVGMNNDDEVLSLVSGSDENEVGEVDDKYHFRNEDKSEELKPFVEFDDGEVVELFDEDESVSPDEALNEVGGFGTFQKLTTFSMGYCWVVCGIHVLLSPFVRSGIVDEWDPGDRKHLADIAVSMFFLGWLFGAGFFGILSDRVGRKKCLLATTILCILASLLSATANSYTVYVVWRMLTGAAIGGLGLASWVIAAEWWGGEHRNRMGCLFHIFFAVGVAIVSILAFTTRDSLSWRWLTVVATIPTILILGLYPSEKLVPESFRWLLVVRRMEDAKRLLSVAANTNKNGMWSGNDTPILIPVAPTVSKASGKWYDLFVHKRLCGWTAVILYIWFAASFSYYGISIAITRLTSDIYLAGLLSGVVEIPGYLCAIYLLSALGRVGGMMLFALILGVSCVILALFSSISVQFALALIGKFGSSGLFAAVYLQATEVFPTDVRNFGTGLASQFARLGGIVAPLTIAIFSSNPVFSMLVFGLSAFLVSMLVRRLPETIGKKLPETVEEALRL